MDSAKIAFKKKIEEQVTLHFPSISGNVVLSLSDIGSAIYEVAEVGMIETLNATIKEILENGLSSEVEILKRKGEETDGRIDMLTAEIAELVVASQDSSAKLADVRLGLAKANDRLSHADEQMKNLSGHLDAQDRSFNGQFKGIDGQFKAVNGRLDVQAEATSGQFKAVNERLDAQAEATSGQFKAVNGRLDAQDRSFNGQFKGIDGQFKALGIQFEVMNARLDTHIAASNDYFKSIDDQLKELRKDLKLHRRLVTPLSYLTVFGGLIGTVGTFVAIAFWMFGTVGPRIERLETRVDKLEAGQVITNEKLDEVLIRLDNLQAQQAQPVKPAAPAP
jgi:chaperonin cofactor prefoldin